jgi:hypothetical protein
MMKSGLIRKRRYKLYPMAKKKIKSDAELVKEYVNDYYPGQCASHKPILIKMGYIAAHNEAERRMKKGQKQKQCPVCHLWFFPDEF